MVPVFARSGAALGGLPLPLNLNLEFRTKPQGKDEDEPLDFHYLSLFVLEMIVD